MLLKLYYIKTLFKFKITKIKLQWLDFTYAFQVMMNVTEMVSNVYFEIQLPTVIGLCLQFKLNVIEILCNV